MSRQTILFCFFCDVHSFNAIGFGNIWRPSDDWVYYMNNVRMMTSSNGNIFRVTGHLCGNSPVPVKSPHKGQWRGALMFSLYCARINVWVNNREADDLRRNRAHYDVNVMTSALKQRIRNMSCDIEHLVLQCRLVVIRISFCLTYFTSWIHSRQLHLCLHAYNQVLLLHEFWNT